MELMRLIWSIDIILNCLGFMLHCLGIYAVISSKRRTNQTVILASLSFTELFCTMYMATNDIIRQVRYDGYMFDNPERMKHYIIVNILPPIYNEINFALYFVSGIQLILVCSILTADRLLCALNPLKYKIHVTKKRLMISIIVSWIISILLGICYGLFPKSIPVLIGFGCCVAATYLFLAIFTYTLICYKLKISIRKSNTGSTQVRRGIQFEKQYMIPGLIIMTYFLLYFTPVLIQRFAMRPGLLTKRKCLIHESLAILTDFGIICDALIYEFLIKDFRKLILAKLLPCKKHSRQTVAHRKYAFNHYHMKHIRRVCRT